MDKRRSQRYNFAFETVPILFHSQTSEFLKYLDKDGLKFLQFWWDHVGERLPEAKLAPFEGFQVEITEPEPGTKVIFITMSPPLEDDEPYFLGLISRPEKRFAWVRLPTTRVLTLVRKADGPQFGDLTPRAIFVAQEVEVEPTLEAFKKAVMDLV